MRKNNVPFPSENVTYDFIDNKFKCLWNLPSLEKPTPIPTHLNTKSVALVVLFIDPYHRPQNLQAWVRGAIYNRWSALMYTDAIAQGIEVKFYFEDVLRQMLEPVLLENHVDPDKDVIWFHASPPQDKVWGHLGKKMVTYWDPQLQHYDRIINWDADTFFLPRPNKMFEKLHNIPTDKIAFFRAFLMEWAIRKSGFIAKVQRDTRKSNIPVDKLFAMSGVNPNDFTDSVYKMSGFLWTYSPAYFHKHCTDFVNWMSTHAPYLGNDEETLSIAAQLFNMEFLSLYEPLGLKMHQIDILLDLDDAAKDINIVHGMFHAKDEKQAAFHKLLGIR